MELYLQYGYGMMEHSRALVAEWGGGTVILSPRDLADEQLRRLAREIVSAPGGAVLIDPQFYLPHADHGRLVSHAYWPADYDTSAFWQGAPLATLLDSLQELNDASSSSAMILPGMLASAVDSDWLTAQKLVAEEAASRALSRPFYATVALSADALRDPAQVGTLIEESAKWPVKGYYVVAEHPKGAYLSDDPNWLANVIDVAAAFRMRSVPVILGYCNHQLLIAACAKASAIASGTWMNVRSFPPDKFRTDYEEEVRQRATWYYCPHALSEFKIPFLDIAHRRGILPQLQSTDAGSHAAPLFSAPLPSSAAFGEREAFRHYLGCLRVQALDATRATFDETVSAHEALLNEADKFNKVFAAAGVRGQLRDFGEIADVNRAALGLFTATRGLTLRRAWSTL